MGDSKNIRAPFFYGTSLNGVRCGILTFSCGVGCRILTSHVAARRGQEYQRGSSIARFQENRSESLWVKGLPELEGAFRGRGVKRFESAKGALGCKPRCRPAARRLANSLVNGVRCIFTLSAK